MKPDLGPDAFTNHVMNGIDPDIRQSLSSEQYTAIVRAVGAAAPKTRHAVDFRGVIPLFFIRIYFVFLMGRDRRYSVSKMETERRRGADILSGMVFILFILIPILVLMFLGLYFVKSEIGVDIFPDKHLIDFFRWR